MNAKFWPKLRASQPDMIMYSSSCKQMKCNSGQNNNDILFHSSVCLVFIYLYSTVSRVCPNILPNISKMMVFISQNLLSPSIPSSIVVSLIFLGRFYIKTWQPSVFGWFEVRTDDWPTQKEMNSYWQVVRNLFWSALSLTHSQNIQPINQSELHHFLGKLLIGQLISRAA